MSTTSRKKTPLWIHFLNVVGICIVISTGVIFIGLGVSTVLLCIYITSLIGVPS